MVIGSHLTGPQVAATFIPRFMDNSLEYDEKVTKHKMRVDKIMLIEKNGADLYCKKTD